jgi:hypothetical protein
VTAITDLMKTNRTARIFSVMGKIGNENCRGVARYVSSRHQDVASNVSKDTSE